MFVRRLKTSLKEQHWMTIAIELVIVIIGVFIGNQVSNWNQARIEKAETRRMVDQLRPELQNQIAFFNSARAYYRTTRPFADRALAAWAGDRRIDDNQFVIAAYQASQIYGIGINAQNWALVFGGNALRQIDDQKIRKDLAVVLTADYEPVGFNAVATPYREHVRQIIPASVQDQIRQRCGDRNVTREGSQFLVFLPPRCPLVLSPGDAARAAAALRAHPELVPQLNWHLAAIANYLTNVDGLQSAYDQLQRSLDKRS
jgi:hypothetical protein